MKCEMKTMLVPSSRSRRSVANSRSTSGGERAEVGSSRMMMRAPGEQHAGDLDQLLQPDREVAEPRHRIDVDAEAGELLAGLARHAPPLHEAEPVGRLVAQEHVLGHRQVGRDAELLMHHGDAGRVRVAHRAEVRLLAVEQEAAGEIGVHAGDDLHQRAFAGAVLADETVDLAGREREIDTTKRLDAAEGSS